MDDFGSINWFTEKESEVLNGVITSDADPFWIIDENTKE